MSEVLDALMPYASTREHVLDEIALRPCARAVRPSAGWPAASRRSRQSRRPIRRRSAGASRCRWRRASSCGCRASSRRSAFCPSSARRSWSRSPPSSIRCSARFAAACRARWPGRRCKSGTIVELTTRALDEAVDAAMLFLPDGKLRDNALITVEDPLYPRDVPLQALRVKIDRRLGLWLLGQADSSAPAWLERVLPRRVLAQARAARRAQSGSARASGGGARRGAAHARRAAGSARRRQEVRRRGAVRRARAGAVRRRLPRHAARAARLSIASSCRRGWRRCGARRSSSARRPTSIITTAILTQARSGGARRARQRVARGAVVADVQDAAGARRASCASCRWSSSASRSATRRSPRRGRWCASTCRFPSPSQRASIWQQTFEQLHAERRRRRGRLGRDRPQARARRRAHPVGGALGGRRRRRCARTAARRW